jgi:hypothetical protein
MRSIQARQDARRHAIDLDSRHFRGFGQISWHRPDEVADARRGFQHTAAPKTQPANGAPHRLDHEDFREVGVDDTRLGAFVIFAQHIGQGLGSRLPRPIVLIGIERLGNAAPSGEPVEDGALVVVGSAVLCGQAREERDGRQVRFELGDVTTKTRMQRRVEWVPGTASWPRCRCRRARWFDERKSDDLRRRTCSEHCLRILRSKARQPQSGLGELSEFHAVLLEKPETRIPSGVCPRTGGINNMGHGAPTLARRHGFAANLQPRDTSRVRY